MVILMIMMMVIIVYPEDWALGNGENNGENIDEDFLSSGTSSK